MRDMMKKMCRLAAAFLSLVPGAAFAAPAEISAWFAHSAVKILRDAPPGAGPQQWDLAAARNETEACQIVLRSDKPCPGVVVSVTPFRLAGGGARLQPELYQVAYVPDIVGKTPYPDPLPPLRPLTLEPGQAQPVWISLRVPNDALPGTYSAEVTVEANARRKLYPLKLRVWDFALPQTPTCATAFGIDTDSIARQHRVPAGAPAVRRLYERYYAMLLDHRISAYAIPADLMSEEAAHYLEDPRLTSFVIPYPAGDDDLKKLVARLVDRGWFSRGVFYPIDEPVTKGAYTTLETISRRLHKFSAWLSLGGPLLPRSRLRQDSLGLRPHERQGECLVSQPQLFRSRPCNPQVAGGAASPWRDRLVVRLLWPRLSL